MMLEVKNFTKIFDSMRIRIVNQSYPAKKYFGPPPIGGVGGSGSPIIGTPISHFIGGSESVKKYLGFRGIMAV